MKKRIFNCLLIGSFLGASFAEAQTEGQNVVTREVLNRGLIAVKTTSGNFVSWRKHTTDDSQGYSYLLKIFKEDGSLASEQTFAAGSPTNYLDKTKGTSYTLLIKDAQGEVLENETMSVEPMAKQLNQVKLNRPTGSGCTYTPNDCSAGDVDGDGSYEIIVKWDPSNSQDNSKGGKTGNTYFDAYRITGPNAGEHLWRIDLGVNVRAGAHYSPFLVYDFDGDGKSEFVVKTAPGSKDGKGKYVSEASSIDAIRNIKSNSTDYRNSDGHILKGEEFLTIFNGETGEAIETIWYWPNHARQSAAGSASTTYSWTGDSYGNRGHRYNACVAYLDGEDHLPSIIMQRGYYTQAYFWAVDFDGKKLTTRWLHRGTGTTSWSVIDGNGKTLSSGSGKSSYGQGVHGISVGDVDLDGCDEIVMGSATIDHDGRLLCSTGFGHGDAIHLSTLNPDREGLQVYMPHEEKNCGYGDDMHDAQNGQVLARGYTEKDNGRGLAADMFYSINASTGLDDFRGYEYWSGATTAPTNAITGKTIGSKPDSNFRIYWNGDLYDESLDGRFDSNSNTCNPRIISWTGSAKKEINIASSYGGKPQSCNYTKATPCLVADLYGDWREEMVFWDASDAATLDIYTTVDASIYPVPCLMEDHLYRLGIAWQNSSYNQPPHLGYYLPDVYNATYEIDENSANWSQTFRVGEPMQPIVYKLQKVEEMSITGTPFSTGINAEFDKTAQTLTISGTPTIELGSSGYNIYLDGKYNRIKIVGRITIEKASTDAIEKIEDATTTDKKCYNLQGQRINDNRTNTIIIDNGDKVIAQ